MSRIEFAVMALGIIGVVILVAVLVISTPGIGSHGQQTDSDAITFWHDDARNVGCWIYHSGYRGGLSCLSDGSYGR